MQWQKNWVSCLLKLLSNYNFKLENHAIFYDFQSTLTFLVILGPRGGVKSPLSPQEALIYQNATYFYHFDMNHTRKVLKTGFMGVGNRIFGHFEAGGVKKKTKTLNKY